MGGTVAPEGCVSHLCFSIVSVDLLSPSAPGLEHAAVCGQSVLGHACRDSPGPPAASVTAVSPQGHS